MNQASWMTIECQEKYEYMIIPSGKTRSDFFLQVQRTTGVPTNYRVDITTC